MQCKVDRDSPSALVQTAPRCTIPTFRAVRSAPVSVGSSTVDSILPGIVVRLGLTSHPILVSIPIPSKLGYVIFILRSQS